MTPTKEGPSASPSPPQSHHNTAQLGGETFLVPLQPDPNLLEPRAVTSLAQRQSQPAALPLGSKISPGSSGKADPRTVCAARRGISRNGGMSPSLRHALLHARQVGKSRSHTDTWTSPSPANEGHQGLAFA